MLPFLHLSFSQIQLNSQLILFDARYEIILIEFGFECIANLVIKLANELLRRLRNRLQNSATDIVRWLRIFSQFIQLLLLNNGIPILWM